MARLAALPGSARRLETEGQVRHLRVSPGVWRLSSAGVRGLGRLPGRGAVLHLRADEVAARYGVVVGLSRFLGRVTLATWRFCSKIYVIDTNALLNDPDVIHSFSGAEVVVPAAVLRELDDLKRKRSDARIRFHGRKATRVLFDATRNGRLIDGVHLANGAVLRVDATEQFDEPAADLDLTRTDDIILALAHSYQRRPGSRATVVSNDLNLLLRAEAMGLDTYRFEGKLQHIQHIRRTPMEWFRDMRFMILLEVLVVAAGGFYGLPVRHTARRHSGPHADRHRLRRPSRSRHRSQGAGTVLPWASSKNPSDFKSLVNLGNLAFDDGRRFLEAVDYYRRALDDPARRRRRAHGLGRGPVGSRSPPGSHPGIPAGHRRPA